MCKLNDVSLISKFMKIEYVVLNDSLELQPQASRNRTLELVDG
jgi:hypothetical protein